MTTADELLKQASEFEKLAEERRKLDPKAKVRNRGTVCVPAESAKDKKDHFPINDEDQARNALARVHQYSSAPSWYKGSLKGLQDLVSRKVHSKYPSIGKSEKKKKSSLEEVEHLLNKYAQNPLANGETDLQSKLHAALVPYGYGIGGEVKVMKQEGYVDVPVRAGAHAKFLNTGRQGAELKKILDPLVAPLGLVTRPTVMMG